MSTLKDKNFSDDILQKIKQAKLLPRPKWQFLLKNSIIWFLGLFSLALGSISTSLAFYMIRNDDAGFYGRAGSNFLETLLFVIPFFWLLCLIIFAMAVYFYIKHTKKGYKYSAKKIILAIIGASLLIGALLNIFGFDRLVDDVLGERAPFYDRVINPRLKYWSKPDNGRLTGIIISKTSPLEYALIDQESKVWNAMLNNEIESEKIIIGHPVMLLGEKISDYKFIIKEILPVGPGRGFFKRPRPGGEPQMCEHGEKENLRPCELPLLNQFDRK